MTETPPNFHYSLPEEEIDEKAKTGQNPLLQTLGKAKWFAALAVIGLGLIAVIVWQLWGAQQSGRPADVKLNFDIQTGVTAGSATEFSLLYENRDAHALKSAHLEVIYPDAFRFLNSSVSSREGTGRNFDFDTIPSGGSGKIVINGIFSGIPDEAKLLQAKMYYQLDNSSAQFATGATAQLMILAANFNLRVTGPAQVISSQKIDYVISFQNISEQTLPRAELRLELPAGFQYASSSSPTQDKKIWELGSVIPTQEGRLVVHGRISGASGEEQVLRAELGYIKDGGFVLENRAYFTSTIIDSPLQLTYASTAQSGITEEGQAINFSLNYVNAGSQGIHNARMGIHFETEALDFRTARPEGGALVGHDALWNASAKPQLVLLQPGERGTFSFKISVRANLASTKLTDPAIRFSVWGSADEFDEPILSAASLIKLRSHPTGSIQLAHLSGPQPPLPDQDSQYRLTLQVNASFNELKDMNFAGFLNIPFVTLVEGTVQGPGEQAQDLKYTASSGRFSWQVGSLPAYTSRSISFLVSVRADSGSNLTLPVSRNMEINSSNVFTAESLPALRLEDTGIKLP